VRAVSDAAITSLAIAGRVRPCNGVISRATCRNCASRPPPTAQAYERLRALTQNKDRFVITSNADDLFARTGFDEQGIWTRQGSHSRLQYLTPWRPSATWMAEPWVKAALPEVDVATEESLWRGSVRGAHAHVIGGRRGAHSVAFSLAVDVLAAAIDFRLR